MKQRSCSDCVTVFIVYGSAIIVLLSTVCLFLSIIGFALPVLIKDGVMSSLQLAWSPKEGVYGILAVFIGSCLVSGLAIIIATPFAIMISLWIVALGRGVLQKVVKGTVQVMASIPTVVYGFIALFLLTPLIRQWFGGSGLSWLTASLMVSLLILPTMIFILLTGLESSYQRMKITGASMGFSSFEIVYHLVLPTTKKTIIASILLGLGRAIGDTLLPLMLAGNAIHIPSGLTDNVRTLTAHMALVTANEVGGMAYNSLFVAGLILLLISVFIRLLSQKILNRLA